MPCRDTSDEQSAYELVRPRLDHLAQMLCALCRQCEAQDAAHWIDEAGARAWWDSHKRDDERRLAAETEERRVKAEREAENRREYMTVLRDGIVVFGDDELAAMGLRRIATERAGGFNGIV